MSDAIDRAAEVLSGCCHHCDDAAFERAENLRYAGLLADEDMESRFAEFLCEMTGGLLSKTGYDVRTMVQAADDYYERCRDRTDAEVGLPQDSATLDAYLDMARAAREHIYEHDAAPTAHATAADAARRNYAAMEQERARAEQAESERDEWKAESARNLRARWTAEAERDIALANQQASDEALAEALEDGNEWKARYAAFREDVLQIHRRPPGHMTVSDALHRDDERGQS